MNIDFTITPGVIRVPLVKLGFGDFYALIVPDPEKSMQNYYLMHEQSAVVLYMFGSQIENAADAAEMAYWNAMDHIPDFVKQHFADEE